MLMQDTVKEHLLQRIKEEYFSVTRESEGKEGEAAVAAAGKSGEIPSKEDISFR